MKWLELTSSPLSHDFAVARYVPRAIMQVLLQGSLV